VAVLGLAGIGVRDSGGTLGRAGVVTTSVDGPELAPADEPTAEDRAAAIRALAHPDRLRQVFGSALYSSPDAQAQAQVVCTLVARLLQCRHAAVSLLAADRAITVATEVNADRVEVALAQAVCQMVVHVGRPYVIVDATTNALLDVSVVKQGVLRCYLGAPLVLHGQVVGALCVYGQDRRPWTVPEVELVQAFAAILTTGQP
jgi:signal transduction protein with GAF and PtsI domain